MRQIGLITFHAAYNHGSALQALATQISVEKLADDIECRIVNYRTDEQKQYYCQLYRWKYGPKVLLRDLLQYPIRVERKNRMASFERFFADYMHLTEEVSTPIEVLDVWSRFSTMISGSDQIWSKHTCENEGAPWEYMAPYLQTGFTGRKVSYATSIGRMSDDELRRILPEISEFDTIAVREQRAANKLSEMLGRNIEVVLDPTLLLDHEDWTRELNLVGVADAEPYLLYYSLGGIRGVREAIPHIVELAKKRKMKRVVVITPFTYYKSEDPFIELHPECGPIEFLNYLESASISVTDSYHGTLFSVNFGKDLYSICLGSPIDYRKTELLEKVGMEDRVVHSLESLNSVDSHEVDYEAVYHRLDMIRGSSINYLERALMGDLA